MCVGVCACVYTVAHTEIAVVSIDAGLGLPVCPVAKILSSQRRGSGFGPRSVNEIPHATPGVCTSRLNIKDLPAVTKIQHSQIKKCIY